MVFLIETNTTKEEAKKFQKELISYLLDNQQELTDCANKADIIISLGGDGTLIQTANKYRMAEKPILGINCGTLGYLTELTINNYKEKLQKLINDKYFINKRLVLSAQISNNFNTHKIDALNDIVIKNTEMSLVELDIYVNNSFLTSYKADGLIVSTPTGSTGYSLSCGGAFVDPDANVILLNAIAPHTLLNRSVILNEESIIKIVVKNENGKTAIASDGKIISELVKNDYIIVKKSKLPTLVAEIDKESFINIISTKLTK